MGLATASVIALEIGSGAVMYSAENPAEPAAAVINEPTPRPTVTDIYALRGTYPDTPAPYRYPQEEYSYIDYGATTEAAVVYRYQGLEGISFARPSAEVNNAIENAFTVEELQAAVDPYYAAMGMKLYLTDDGPNTTTEGYYKFTNDQLELARHFVRSINDAVSTKPRELLAFSDVKDIYVPYVANPDGNPILNADGYAFTAENRRSIMIIGKKSRDRSRIINVTDHEIGHHLRDRLNEKTDGGFDVSMGNANPRDFEYKDFIQTQAEALWHQRTYGNENALGISTDYGATAPAEDAAEMFAQLESDKGVPSPDDILFPYGTAGYDKKMIMIDSLDQFVPGYKRYKIGSDTLVIYRGQHTPDYVSSDLRKAMGSELVAAFAPDNYRPEDSQFIDMRKWNGG